MELKIDGFSTVYQKRKIINAINLCLKKKEWLGIIGANGSGKSTLLKGISRILEPIEGFACLDNIDIHKSATKSIAKKLAFLPQQQNNNLMLTVKEFVCLGRSPHKEWWEMEMNSNDLRKVDEALQLTDMEEFSDYSISNLSGGQRQRAFLALALAQNPKILLLDEPTTFLDIKYQLQFLDLIKNLILTTNLSVITVIHDINLAARYCDKIAILKEGKLLKVSSPSEILTKDLIREAFGVEIIPIDTPIGMQVYTVSASKY